jgi:hypothetical protein
MDPITAVASTIVTLIFSEAFKEGGKSLGKGVSAHVAQLIHIIHQTFQKAGTEGVLTRAERQPTESNIAIVEAELVTLMEEGKTFARQLEESAKRFEQAGITRQVMVSGIKANNIEVENMTQKANRGGMVDQVMGNDLEAVEDIRLGNLTQEG